MRGRGQKKPELYSLKYIEDFFRTENNADGRRSFPPGARSLPNKFLNHCPEVFDRATEGILELYLRLPFQESARPTDIGSSDFGIIGGQRVMSDVARRTGKFQYQFRDLQDGQLTRIPDIHGIMHGGSIGIVVLRDEELAICPLFDILV